MRQISKNPRDLNVEFDEFEEPDSEEPQKWLEEYREDPEKVGKIKSRTQKLLKQFDIKNEDVVVGGQSHIDVAWKWRYWQTIRRLLERVPE